MKKETKEFFIKLLYGIAAIVGIASLFFVFDDYLSNKINEKITNKNYIKNLSITLRPFLIFDQYEIITYDHGAVVYIDSIKVHEINPTHLTQIIIYPNKYFQIAPLLESLGPDIYDSDAQRGTGNIWIYKLKTPMVGGYTSNKFRLEILK